MIKLSLPRCGSCHKYVRRNGCNVCNECWNKLPDEVKKDIEEKRAEKRMGVKKENRLDNWFGSEKENA